MGRKPMTIRWPDSIREEVERLMGETGLSYSKTVIMLVTKGIKRLKWGEEVIKQADESIKQTARVG